MEHFMRALKFIGVLFLLLLVVLLTLPIIMPDKAETSESIFIESNAQTVFRQVNNLKNWSNWSPFNFDNPQMESVYDGPEFGVGSRHIWKSEEMGNGSMIVLTSIPYEFIQILLDMKEGGRALDEWIFEEKEGGVHVTWTLKLSELKYPFYRYFGFFLGSMMKPMQEKGLIKLKEVSELSKKSIPIELVEIESQPSVVIFDSAMMNEMGTKMHLNFSEIDLYMKRAKIQSSGYSFAMYYNWDKNKPIKFGVGYPVSEEVKESGRVNFFSRPAGNALKGKYTGPYSSSAQAHLDFDKYIEEFGYKQSQMPIWEEYITGPNEEVDSTRWITHIYYFIDIEEDEEKSD
jgi:effector-binding domain-containing protein